MCLSVYVCLSMDLSVCISLYVSVLHHRAHSPGRSAAPWPVLLADLFPWCTWTVRTVRGAKGPKGKEEKRMNIV
jgi:hypothetical protein